MAEDTFEVGHEEDDVPVVVGNVSGFKKRREDAALESERNPIKEVTVVGPTLSDLMEERRKRAAEGLRALIGQEEEPDTYIDDPEIEEHLYSRMPGDDLSDMPEIGQNNPYYGLNPAKIKAAIDSGALTPHRRAQAEAALQNYHMWGENIFGKGPGDF